MRRRERLRAMALGILIGLLAADLGITSHRIAGLIALALWGWVEWTEWRRS